MHKSVSAGRPQRFLLFAVCLWQLCRGVLAAGVLAPGDVAVVGFNADGSDDFSFVVLRDLQAGLPLLFSDGEGTITYTSPADGLPFGSLVVIFDADSPDINASTGAVARTAGDYDFAAGGDALEVKYGTSYIYVSETAAAYAPPPQSDLSMADATWVSHTDAIDNGRYTGPRTGTRRGILRGIAEVDNWEYGDGSGDQSLDLDTAPFNSPFSAVPAILLKLPNVRVAEDAGTVGVGVTLDRAPLTNAAVRFNTLFDTAVPGRDFAHTNGVIAWAAGDRSTQNVEIAILDNGTRDGPRVLHLFLYQPESCEIEGRAIANITIIDNDVELPAVSNRGATNLAARSAVLRGSVASAGACADAAVYWGPDDGGTNAAAWSNVVSAGTVDGVFEIGLAELTPGTAYRYRCAASNLAGTAWAPSTADFTTLAASNYFVNDGSLTGDIYCTAAGSDSMNDGRSAGAPKATVQAVLSAYDLGPGDAIFIDTGVYNLTSTIDITADDRGAPGNPVVLRGSTAAAGSLFDRNNSSEDVIYVYSPGDCHIRIENLLLTGGKRGIYARGTDPNYCRGLAITGCEVYGNDSFSSQGGIFLQYCADAVVLDCDIHDNGANAGLALHYIERASVVSNSCYANGVFGIDLKYCEEGAVFANTVSNHSSGHGISSSWGEGGVYNGNVCRYNGWYGLDLYNCAGGELINNTSYGNSSYGIRVIWDGIPDGGTTPGPAIMANRVFANGGNGIEDAARGAGHRVVNNLVYGNGGYNVRFVRENVEAVFENNTLYGGAGVYYRKPGAGSNRHNILWATGAGNTGIWVQNLPADPAQFVSDYNNFFASDGADAGRWPLPDGDPAATLGEWRSDSFKDWNSISFDPLFADAGNGDFHIASRGGSFHDGLWHGDAATSPCLDAGDPRSDFEAEPPFNGLRLNMGAYGNTREASRTLETGPFYSLTLEAVPEGAGTTAAWPPAPAYPHGAEITAWAVVTDSDFRWDRWEGGLAGSEPTNVFVIAADIIAQAVFVATNANTYGIPESWLIAHGIPPTQQGAEMDSDADGLQNWEEYYAGTVPTNELSVLALSDVQEAGNRLALVFASVTGITYRAQSTPALTAAGAWTNEAWSATRDGAFVDAPIEGHGGEAVVFVSTGGVIRCYRVRLEPPNGGARDVSHRN